MNEIKEWAIMLCVISVGSTFVIFLVPKGNLRKSTNITITLVMLSIVTLPFFGKNSLEISIPDISIDEFPDKNDYIQNENDFFVISSEFIVRQQIEEILAGICSDDFSVDTEIYTDAKGDVVLSDIHIFIQSSDSGIVNIIKNNVGKITGIMPEVIVENGNTGSD